MRRVLKAQRSRGRVAEWKDAPELNDWNSLITVRPFEFESLYGLDMLVPGTKDSNTTVWVTAYLGTRQNIIFGAANHDETDQVSLNASSCYKNYQRKW